MVRKLIATSLRFSLVTLVLAAKPSHADSLSVYIDADFTVSNSVANAVELGLRTALAEGDNLVAGLPVQVVALDHRSNPRRSLANLQRFDRDPSGIAVFGGKQSPPYLIFGEQINARGIPMLLPWSAAGPLTRLGDGQNNFFFRLSVDDTKAGPFLVRTAVANECSAIALVVIDNGWGHSNRETMTKTLSSIWRTPFETVVVSSNLGPVAAKNAARDVARMGADCLITVLTVPVGILFLNALHDLAPDIDVYSHWGIMSERFTNEVSALKRDALDLRILQTCGLDVERQGSAVLDRALEGARIFEPGILALDRLDAPAAFVHAYDLGMLFRAAAEQAALQPEWFQGPRARRQALRDALEALTAPVNGILKTYNRPFEPVSEDNPDGHEALGQDEFCLVQYGVEGQVMAAESVSN